MANMNALFLLFFFLPLCHPPICPQLLHIQIVVPLLVCFRISHTYASLHIPIRPYHPSALIFLPFGLDGL